MFAGQLLQGDQGTEDQLMVVHILSFLHQIFVEDEDVDEVLPVVMLKDHLFP